VLKCNVLLWSVQLYKVGFTTIYVISAYQGRIQDFKLGGAHLKKLRRAEGGEKIFGVFRVKNHDFTQKNHIFSNFRGGARAGCAPPMLYREHLAMGDIRT
jgi:hypothetical protein